MSLTHALIMAVLIVQQNNVVPDEITTRDGTKLSGTLVSWNRTEVVVRTADGQIHRLAPEAVDRMSLGGESVNATTARLPEPPPPPPPAPEPPPREKIWKGTADASYAGHRGTTDSDSLVLEFNSERKTDRHRLQLHSRYFYAIRDSALAGNELLGGARLDRFFSPKFFVFGSADFEFDEVEKIDLRHTYASGFGYDVLVSDARRLSLSGGGGYTRENFSDGARKNSLSGLFNQEFQQKLLGRSQLEQTFRALQDLGETARFRLRLEVGLRTKLNDLLSFRVGVADAYDNRPRPNVRKNELSFTTGLGFTF